MYAIIEIGGKQLKLSPGQYAYAPKMEEKEGKSIKLGSALLIGKDDDTVEVGTPILKDVTVSCKVLGHVKGDKIIVFKKKRRKGYAVKNGHRQQYTKLFVETINN